MRLTNTLLFLTAFTFVSSLSFGEVDRLEPSSMGYGVILTVNGLEDDKVYSFPLPAEVYEHVYYADLRDVLLINEKDELVPFTFVMPKVKGKYRGVPPKTAALTPRTAVRDNKTVTEFLIADISPHKERVISGIELVFKGDAEFTGTVRAEGSSTDLDAFSIANYGVTVARIGRGGKSIVQNSIPFERELNDLKYLRLMGESDVLASIKEVVLNFEPELVSKGDGNIEKILMAGKVSEDGKSVNFELPGYYPVDFVGVDIPKSYLFPRFDVYYTDNKSAGAEFSPFSLRAELTSYRLKDNVTGFYGGGGRHKIWRITAQNRLPESGVGAHFYRRAENVVFMAKGEGPYKLLFGRRDMSLLQFTALREEGAEAVTPVVSEMYIIQGEKALAEETPKKTYRKQILLAFLVAVVLSISAVAVLMAIKNSK